LTALSGAFALFTGQLVLAQKDSISLQEVAIRGFSPVRYMAGSYVQRLDSTLHQQYASRRLDELLGQYTSLAFRSYGNGQMSTIAFRGLTSSHTAVIWNGININLPSIGQTDFTSLNLASMESVAIQYGAGSSNLGSDAIGGSILLDNAPVRNHGLHIQAGGRLGSYENHSYQLNARYRTSLNDQWHFAGKTGFFRAAYPNRYPELTFKGRRLESSSTYQYSITQDLYWEHRKGQTLSAHFWFNNHDITQRPNQPAFREFTGMESTRALLKYADDKWNLSASFVRDITDYGTGDYSFMDRSLTDRYGIKVQREWMTRFSKSSLSFLTGLDFNHFRAKVNGYESPQIDENRADLYLLSRWQLDQGLVISLNLRQAINEGYRVPFTPSVGLDLPLYSNSRYRLGLSGNLAKSYRVPTLNERYWKDLGNPDILPESGMNMEIGLYQDYQLLKYFQLKTRYNAFHNLVDNWVYWNPSSSYRAENLQQVLSRGVEFHHHLTYHRSHWSAGITSLVSHTRSTQQKAYDHYSEEILGRQIRFVPVWVSNLNAFVSYRQSTLTLQHHFESRRYINDLQYLPPYYLIDLMLDQSLRAGRTIFSFQARASNLTNQLYLNVRSNAMPGRNFHISLFINHH